MLGKDI